MFVAEKVLLLLVISLTDEHRIALKTLYVLRGGIIMSFLRTDITRVVEILRYVRKGPTDST